MCNPIKILIYFQVKAYNTKGHSEYSQETVAMTKVDRIPAPQRVTFDPESHALTINIGATCLQLVRFDLYTKILILVIL